MYGIPHSGSARTTLKQLDLPSKIKNKHPIPTWENVNLEDGGIVVQTPTTDSLHRPSYFKSELHNCNKLKKEHVSP